MMRSNQQGLALLIVLLMIVLLTTIVVSFAYQMQVEAALVENESDTLYAYLAAKSAVADGMGILTNDLIDPANEPGYDGLDEEWYMLTHPQDSPVPGFAQAIPVAGDEARPAETMLVIEDEWGKFPLNAIVDPIDPTLVNENMVTMLINLFDQLQVDENPAEAIVDWLDGDDEPRGGLGAEASYYESLEVPFTIKNGPMDSIEELLMIRGITPEVYFGDPENEIPPLYELLTVHGHPLGRVNVNTAPFEVLLAIETTGNPEASVPNWNGLAQAVINQQEAGQPITTDEEFRNFVTVPEPREEQTAEDVMPPVVYGSRVFHIQGDGMSNGVQTRIDAYVWRAPEGEGQAVERYRVLEWKVTQ